MFPTSPLFSFKKKEKVHTFFAMSSFKFLNRTAKAAHYFLDETPQKPNFPTPTSKKVEMNLETVRNTFKSIANGEPESKLNKLINEHILLPNGPTKLLKKIYEGSGMKELLEKGGRTYLTLSEFQIVYQFYIYTGFKILGVKFSEGTIEKFEDSDSWDSIYSKYSLLNNNVKHMTWINDSQIGHMSDMLDSWNGIEFEGNIDKTKITFSCPNKIYCVYTIEDVTDDDPFFTLDFSSTKKKAKLEKQVPRTSEPKEPQIFCFKKFEGDDPALYLKATLSVLKGLHRSEDIKLISEFITKQKILERTSNITERAEIFLEEMIDKEYNGHFIDMIDALDIRRMVIQRMTGEKFGEDEDDEGE